MKKLNNNGFVLAETLIVTVFILVIFTMLYKNYFPIIGLYEEREDYDDLDGKYTAYWIKQMVESDKYKFDSKVSAINNNGYVNFNCRDYGANNSYDRTMCIELVKALAISKCNDNGNNCEIFITRKKIGDDNSSTGKYFKDVVSNDTSKKFSSYFEDYVNYLPNYSEADPSKPEYRVIIIVHHKDAMNNYYSFATMEVNR